MKGKIVKVGKAHRNSSLCVANIPKDTTKEQIEELLKQYGTLTDIEFTPEKGTAFVTYSKRKEAQFAKKSIHPSNSIYDTGQQNNLQLQLQGKLLSQLNCTWADSASLLNNRILIEFDSNLAMQSQQRYKDNHDTKNSYRNSSIVDSAQYFTEDSLFKAFSQFGVVSRVALKRKDNGQFKGEGDVFYRNTSEGENV
ncbi:MAG: hypothetical protein EZS28_007210 [Streblomastix strix]|uniref:RRM domain-containing protein n=1 Tax=Streblomastix strix TaxID=222440 RepID=A0A5J4WQS3_9EUKA|nr:MAG: hypothetical protein EZS28_007210 [Streblomastix strix]